MAPPFKQMGIGNVAAVSFAFVAGMALDRFWLGAKGSPEQASESRPALKLAFQPKPSGPETDTVRVSQAAMEPARPGVDMSKIRPHEELDEDQGAAVLSALFDPAEELLVERAVRGSLPTAGARTEKLQSDGSVDEYFVSENGAHAFRQKNPQGEVVKDGWTTSGSDNYFRAFYRTGGPKLLSVNRSDGTQTTITFDESGNRETRFDKRTEDQSISVTYDSKGKVREIWQVGRDGRSELMYPES